MLIYQSIGSYLMNNRDSLAIQIMSELTSKYYDYLLSFDLDKKTLLEYAYQDISKLFLAVISQRPAIFVNYIEWQKSMMTSRSVPMMVIKFNLEIFKKIITEAAPEEMKEILSGYLHEAELALDHHLVEPAPFVDPEFDTHQTAQEYLKLILDHKQQEAIDSVLDKIKRGMPLKDVYLNVIQPVQYEIGRLWQLNKINVAQEHFATETSKLLMSQLYPIIKATKRNGKTIVSTCVGSELHEIGIRLVSDYFTLNGWTTYYLGANTPIRSIQRLIEDTNADVLAVSATMSNEIFLVKRLIENLKSSSSSNIKTIVGGNIFNINPELASLVGADAYGKDADHGLEQACKLAKCG